MSARWVGIRRQAGNRTRAHFRIPANGGLLRSNGSAPLDQNRIGVLSKRYVCAVDIGKHPVLDSVSPTREGIIHNALRSSSRFFSIREVA